ncbi:hypothetical protein BDK51DRAFT_47479 [Blyttiomyces helicus]|uniref:Uncharacterized protein n=1 Tax=Blyttiomyces helicus TaxID=388810 RepID=A0A4V1IPZ1_9FUNG|nr:hypothetical protein BDK51DRAFT_47479 [Blyttiomyces helicus]|eukprot:RKO84737.1 hypothetical protein BDK51DRAFT_47479 [Blyttiomyces helicus]
MKVFQKPLDKEESSTRLWIMTGVAGRQSAPSQCGCKKNLCHSALVPCMAVKFTPRFPAHVSIITSPPNSVCRLKLSLGSQPKDSFNTQLLKAYVLNKDDCLIYGANRAPYLSLSLTTTTVTQELLPIPGDAASVAVLGQLGTEMGSAGVAAAAGLQPLSKEPGTFVFTCLEVIHFSLDLVPVLDGSPSEDFLLQASILANRCHVEFYAAVMTSALRRPPPRTRTGDLAIPRRWSSVSSLTVHLVQVVASILADRCHGEFYAAVMTRALRRPPPRTTKGELAIPRRWSSVSSLPVPLVQLVGQAPTEPL